MKHVISPQLWKLYLQAKEKQQHLSHELYLKRIEAMERYDSQIRSHNR